MFKDFFLALFYKLYLNIVGALYVLKEQVIDRHRSPNSVDGKGTKTIVITGGSRGIGLEAVQKFLQLNCNVIVGCRNVEQTKAVLTGDKKSWVKVFHLDLMKLDSIRNFATAVKDLHVPIHALVNNAGIMFGSRKETEDGFESQFATNYLGHFLLSHLLIPNLEETGTGEEPSRIINVSSCAHFLGSWMNFEDLNLMKIYSPELGYGNSKAAQVMFSQYLDSLLATREVNVRVFSLHPGVVYTDLYSNVWWVKVFKLFARCIMKSASQGGDTLIHATLAPELAHAKMKDKYLENSRISRISSFTSSVQNQTKLWKKSCDLLDISNFGKLDN